VELLNDIEMLQQILNYYHLLNDKVINKNNLIYEDEILYNMHINISMQYLSNKIPIGMNCFKGKVFCGNLTSIVKYE
jgi:hypothetical protein